MSEQANAAIYCRVSTEEQAESGTSLSDQARRCEAYCSEMGWLAAGTFVDDGVSGARVDRPALTQLIEAAAQERFSKVVVTDPDRLSRDLVDGLLLERQLANHGVEVVYLVQPAMGTLERQLRGVIAEEERRKIRDRTSRGLRAVAEAGNWPGGPPPYGYEIDSSGTHSRLVICEPEADAIRWMIAMLVDERWSTTRVADELNERQVPTAATARRRTNRGNTRWTHHRVRHLLLNTKGIAGEWVYKTGGGEFRIELPAIVTVERLQQLHRRLDATSTGTGAAAKKYSYLLSGRITSPCGNMMHGMSKPGGVARVYRCKRCVASLREDRCYCRRVSADAVESAVWELLAEALTDPGRLAKLAGLVEMTNAQPTDIADIKVLDRKIEHLESALGTQIAALLARGADAEAVSAASRQLEANLASLKAQRSKLIRWNAARMDRALALERAQRFAAAATSALANADDTTKRNVLDLLEIAVTVTDSRPCPECAGRGLVPSGSPARTQPRGHTGDICPTCRRHKYMPVIEVRGLLPEVGDFPPKRTDDDTIPFTLRSVS